MGEGEEEEEEEVDEEEEGEEDEEEKGRRGRRQTSGQVCACAPRIGIFHSFDGELQPPNEMDIAGFGGVSCRKGCVVPSRPGGGNVRLSPSG